MNKGFWVAKDPGNSGEGDVTCNNASAVESKRPHQWFMEGTEPNFFPNKKQAVELSNETSFSQLLNSSVSTWSNPSSFQSVTGQFPERLFDSEPVRTLNFDDNIHMGRKPNEDPYGCDASFGLSMSHSSDDKRTGLNCGGIRKVKVNKINESENFMASPSENSVTMGLSFNIGDDNMISIGDTCNRENNNFISMGQPYNKGDNIEISMGLTENNGGILMDQASRVHLFNKGDDNMVSMASNSLLMSHSFRKGDSNIISFGGLSENDLNPSGRLLCGYDLVGQSSVSNALSERDMIELNCDSILSAARMSGSGESFSKKKDEEKSFRKTPPNNFPSNVRSLLSTGMLDGVPVKYIAWSREELRGLIKGSAYLCGCQSCSFSKAINAYEFERHAGCKTKHPNNHIYFENGKTVYGIVQELRSTPQNLLFDVIQKISGSPNNPKSFRLWKESFVAATRELQRIYGKEEGQQFV